MRGQPETESTAGFGTSPVAPSLPASGDVIDRKYRVERVLGRGGMGAVLLVVHEHLGTRHALKLLDGDAWQDETFKKRFLREAQAAAALRSRHAAKVSDFGFLSTGAPYMVMEHLSGKDLRQVLDEQGSLPPSDVARVVIQACDALAEAHANGVVHRDLKPANLFLTRDEDDRPCVKVLDFGIAKVPRDIAGDHHLSTTGFFGTAPYVSPEQIRSTKDVDARADVWSLGVTAYELLTGTLPFVGDTALQTFAKILEEEPSPLTKRKPDLPAELEGVVMACLAKRREDRTRDAAALAKAFLPFAPAGMEAVVARVAQRLGGAGEEPGKEPAIVVQSSPAKRSDTDASWADTTLLAPSASRRWWPWAAAGAVVVGLGALWLGLRGPASPPPAPPSAAASAVATPSIPAVVTGQSDAAPVGSVATTMAPPSEAPASTTSAPSAPGAGPTQTPSTKPMASQRARVDPTTKPRQPLPNLPSDDPRGGR